MKVYVEKTETRTYQSLERTICDICGTEEGTGHWQTGNCYDFDDVTIHHEHGSRYPSGGNKEELNLDICPKCFSEKILPVLRSLGVKTQYKETIY